ncbi:L-threonine dehydratase catabolic TdcB [bacterium BMS3Bbin04]|nr:L-threonine dehydratase catabolic TdcB [bacterium BMS3Bbin04]
MSELAVSYKDILSAHERVQPWIHRTPVLSSRKIDEIAGASLFFKAEPLQKTGSFKARGATNAVFSLSDKDAARGVATHSSGNFAAALAQAATWRGIDSHVVMPTSAPEAKRLATRGYGAHIIPCEPTLQARESMLARVVEETGATFLHPYNNANVIAGQGTAGVELMEDVPDLDAVLVPVGGGGLCSGVAIAVHGGHEGSVNRAPDIHVWDDPQSDNPQSAPDIHVWDDPQSDNPQSAPDIHVWDDQTVDQPRLQANTGLTSIDSSSDNPRLQANTGLSDETNPDLFPIKVYGVEPSLADDAKRSLIAGSIQPSNNPDTIADGLKTQLGTLTFPILQHHLEDILLVSEDEIHAAMELIWSRLKLVVEPSGAVVLAALLKHRDLFAGQRVGLVVSGGNANISNFIP